MKALEWWAGPQCSFPRIGGEHRDPIDDTGLTQRLDDIDRLAGLGVRRIRLPMSWARAASDVSAEPDWRWADERLQRLDELGVGAIAGLMHHGSSPRGTHLLDPAFPRLFASHARAVAEHFPQLDAFTPVDAPLATARRCALDGLWPPHHRSDASFVRMLLNQVQATRLAMQAIRGVTPHALLVQTEELGYTQAPPRVQYQANFENLRRWLALDLLAGRVDARHPMWQALLRHGASADELMAMVEAPCPPDVIGVHCHVTSERFLDDRLALYPSHLHGGNRRCRLSLRDGDVPRRAVSPGGMGFTLNCCCHGAGGRTGGGDPRIRRP